ncbi:MAG: dTMP kinase [Candidatus Sumerlaeia bacterium]|nr:dTMP kinase [Candidatus Sumerlaeia bacterium]
MDAPQFSSEILPGFIVFEGLDGAGSSTQAANLHRRLETAGRRSILTSEPTPGPIGTLIKQIMRGRLVSCSTRDETERQLAYLFAADRHDHLYNDIDGVRKLLSDDFLVISTRYHFSSFAYNASNPSAFDLVERLNRDFPLPELVVYLTCPLEVSLARLDKRDVREFYEKEEEQRRVREAYERVLAPLGDRVLRFESTGDPEEVASLIQATVLGRLGAGRC